MRRIILLLALALVFSCSPSGKEKQEPNALVDHLEICGKSVNPGKTAKDVPLDRPDITVFFSDRADVSRFKSDMVHLSDYDGSLTCKAGPTPESVILTPTVAFDYSRRYILRFDKGSNWGLNLYDKFTFNLVTSFDTSDKFPRISDDELFEKVQKAAFDYFWDYGHPDCGLARERLGSGDTVTSGGSGFGVMTIPVGIEHGWITREEGAQRTLKIVKFLQSAERFHGAWSHWINGKTGKAIPFGTKDDGADLVETAFMIEGLLAVKHYFTGADAVETEIRSIIQTLWEEVEWTWFRQGGQNVLYWHWSPNYGWDMNLKIRSWNECLIVYVLAASSPTYPITKEVYDKGWNGTNSYGYKNPLFFVHYSFMGLDPRNLKDDYANYWEQNCRHVRTNYEYCVNSTAGHGYSAECWGLTASDYYNGYIASAPNNDTGTVAPTAALASFPYAPDEAMAAMKYFYYVLGDKLWGQYGFYDAFALKQLWFAKSYIAIDEGPIVVMMENYRTALLWNCFMQDTDVQAGLTKLGFTWN
ncbi:MAG: beta-glucosidase [Bacteroidales bacterium]|nr:beta-glucosidase [Bacteroidales bacterium]